MKYCNLYNVVRVIVHDSDRSKIYKYVPKKNKRNWFHFPKKEGIYYYMNNIIVWDKIPKNHFLLNNELYVKPNIQIDFVDGSTEYVYRDTYKEAVNLFVELTEGNEKWLTLRNN